MNAFLQHIDTLLIANRGEIACRIIRSAKKIGLKTVAVYTPADQQARHVIEADIAIALEDTQAHSGYLDAAQLIDAACRTQAQAIHPGYGFLSENADFAEAVTTAGLRFVGPNANTIRKLGNKVQAKAIAKAQQIPTLESHKIQAKSTHPRPELVQWPWLIKAASGGGGRGMRIVNTPEELDQALEQAEAEALKHFSDATIFLEKYIPQARHIEVQIFGDATGQIQHLWHRDCSVQRRYQKLIEEAPAANLSENLSQSLIEAAIRLAKAEHYLGAGTVEFLVTPDEQWYFLEMNTRLQVEHPATEAISQEDLVIWQLLVADGQPLPPRRYAQPFGHAIEVRICAENPAQQFMPATGVIESLHFPSDPDIRIDSALYEGLRIVANFDSLLAKMIVWAPTRAAAIKNLQTALAKTHIKGIKTNLGFHQQFIATDQFKNLTVSTNTLNSYTFNHHPFDTKQTALILASATYIKCGLTARSSNNPWHQLAGWRATDNRMFQHLWQVETQCCRIRLTQTQQSLQSFDVQVQSWQPQTEPEQQSYDNISFTVTDNNTLVCSYPEANLQRHLQLFWFDEPNGLTLQTQTGVLHLSDFKGQPPDSKEDGAMVSQMPGVVKAILVEHKQVIKQGTPLFIIESMKIEQTITATHGGTVESIFVTVGQAIETQQSLLHLRPLSDPSKKTN